MKRLCCCCKKSEKRKIQAKEEAEDFYKKNVSTFMSRIMNVGKRLEQEKKFEKAGKNKKK